MDTELIAFLNDADPRYNADLRMLGQIWQGPGYHTRIPNGSWAHPTREALDYALALMHSATAEHIERALAIIPAVLALQDRDPTSRTYGIWPWLGEEPLDQMAPPDWNWADFCGARLAMLLIDHAAHLPVPLAAEMRTALGHAAWSIFRRNVGPGYTNIAIMGAGVALLAGELLAEPRLVDYARARLRRFILHTEYHGGLNEYNSPTYTIVLLHECERVLHLATDQQARADLEQIHRIGWQTIAEHFHPPTGQWAGPFSRTYGDRLDAGLVRYLATQTGAALVPHPLMASVDKGGLNLIPARPCPADLAGHFMELAAPQVELRRCFNRGADEQHSLFGTTWMDDTACLGSASWESLWTQRRPLLGYWRTSADPAVVLRLRFLRDGQDFATAGLRCAQQGPRILAALGLFTDRGDFHLHLDRPGDGRFAAADLRLRLELCGAGVSAQQLGAELFALQAGERTAVVHTPAGSFAKQPIEWKLCAIEGGVALDGICTPEGPQVLDPASTIIQLLLAIELLNHVTSPAPAPAIHVGQQSITARWLDQLQITAPISAERYPW